MFPFPEPSLVLIYIQWLRKAFCSLELRVQFCLLVCCTYPSLSTVNKEKKRTEQMSVLLDERTREKHNKKGRTVISVIRPDSRPPRWPSSKVYASREADLDDVRFRRVFCFVFCFVLFFVFFFVFCFVLSRSSQT